MELAEWSRRIESISSQYAQYYEVQRSPEWAMLKLTEEVGELASAWLSLSGGGRTRGKDDADLRADLEHELADVVAMALVLAAQTGVDVEQALTEKWLRYERFHAERDPASTARTDRAVATGWDATTDTPAGLPSSDEA